MIIGWYGCSQFSGPSLTSQAEESRKDPEPRRKWFHFYSGKGPEIQQSEYRSDVLSYIAGYIQRWLFENVRIWKSS